MKFYIQPRQTGKTFMLMDWLHNTLNGVVVVHSFQERDRLARDYPFLADRIYSIDSVIDGRLRGRRNLVVGIDNLDLILPYLIGAPIGPVTATEG